MLFGNAVAEEDDPVTVANEEFRGGGRGEGGDGRQQEGRNFWGHTDGGKTKVSCPETASTSLGFKPIEAR